MDSFLFTTKLKRNKSSIHLHGFGLQNVTFPRCKTSAFFQRILLSRSITRITICLRWWRLVGSSQPPGSLEVSIAVTSNLRAFCWMKIPLKKLKQPSSNSTYYLVNSWLTVPQFSFLKHFFGTTGILMKHPFKTIPIDWPMIIHFPLEITWFFGPLTCDHWLVFHIILKVKPWSRGSDWYPRSRDINFLGAS